MLKFLIFRSFDALAYLLICYVLRRSYSDYYAFRMNIIVRLNKNWGKNLERSFQLSYLKSKGLKKDSVLLDYGCGALSAGRYFIDYLETGHYIGADIAEAVLEEGSKRLAEFGLSERSVRLIHLDSNKLPIEEIGLVDFIWAQSVVTHMSPDDLSLLCSQISRIMGERSEVYFLLRAMRLVLDISDLKTGNMTLRH